MQNSPRSRAPPLFDPDKKAKDLTHAKILEVGENILDERELRYQQDKQKAVADAQAAVTEKLKRKFEREIVKRLEQCKTEHFEEVGTLIDNTEERVQEELAKREAKLQNEMSERLRNLQNKMSQEMQSALDDLRRKHEEHLQAEVQKTFAQKEAEANSKLEYAKRTYIEEKALMKRQLEAASQVKIAESEERAEAKWFGKLADQEKTFQQQMAVALQEVQEQHVMEMKQLQVEIGKRDDHINKLFKAIAFLRNSRRELAQMTIDVYEQMKYFIDKTQPFTDGDAQFLVPRLDLSLFDAEPDTDPPY